MTEDLTHVPRRLRRFYRHNQPIPEGMEKAPVPAPRQKPIEPNEKSEDSDEEWHEPWMGAASQPAPSTPAQPEKPLSRREQHRQPIPVQMPSMPANQVSEKRGLFSRVMDAAAPKPKPMDEALGLQKKQLFEDRLPSSSEKIIQAPNQSQATEVESTLKELKRLAAQNAGKESTNPAPVALTSFHFTPVQGAPNPVDAKNKLDANNMSPRQRVEMRRMRSGETGFGVASGETNPAPQPTPPAREPSTLPSTVPAHIRRRMGQVLTSAEQEAEAVHAEPEADHEPMIEDEDLKSLMGDSAKKKKTKKDEDEDFSIDEDLDSDLAPLDDEEK